MPLFWALKRVRNNSLFYFASVCCEFSSPRQLQKWKHDDKEKLVGIYDIFSFLFISFYKPTISGTTNTTEK